MDVLSWTTLEKVQKGSTQSSGCAEGWGLLSLFSNPRILWFLFLWLGRGFQTIFCRVARAATEHAQVVVEVALSFLQGQLSVFAKLVSDGCGVSRGGLRFVGLLVFVELVVLVAVVGFVAARSLIFLVIGFVAFVVRFVVIVVGLVVIVVDLFFPAWDFLRRHSQ